MLYGLSQPENTPEYDEWEEGQQEKETLLGKYYKILSNLEIEPTTADEVSEYYDKLVSVMCDLRNIVNSICKLEDDFPAGKEPDGDYNYDDSVWEGDR